jgi:ATP-dependent helicase HrpB
VLLPIDAHLDRIVSLARDRRAVVVTAPPGAGKTTRVPPALTALGPVLVLQPRRVAARAIARRIAEEQAWTIGREVGWHVRFDRRASAETRVLVATEGILTARLQADPLLTGVRVLVLDEFHERSIHADLGIALARQAWRARHDLTLVVMSATLDAGRVAAYLDDCPIVSVPGRAFPVDIGYRPGVSIETALEDALPRARGAVLCFLPGAPEIRRAAERIAARPAAAGLAVLPLHGGLDADAQDAALRPSAGRRVILATNLAETTVTVPDVTCVIDTGQHKVARYDPDRAIDSLETERISLDSADQRAGRAGRTQPGAAIRLWDARDRLRPHREPEIARIDLASVALAVLAWGGDPRTLEWLEAPPPAALDAAMTLLERLGAIDRAGRITPLGTQLQQLPLHPRLGRILIAAGGAPEAARACALLSERHFLPARHAATTCDVLAAIDREHALPPHVLPVARQVRDIARGALGAVADRIDDVAFRRAMLAGYPDRVARRRAPRSDRFVLASGTGATLARESGVHDAEFIVAIDVTAGRVGPAGEALVRLATAIDKEWLVATSTTIRHEVRPDGAVRAVRVEQYDALALAEHAVSPDPEAAAELLAEAYLRHGPTEADRALIDRAAFAGVGLGWEELVRAAATGARRLADVDPAARLPAAVRRVLDRDAPLEWRLPTGRSARLRYENDGRVVLRIKLQELFGVDSTPRIGPKRVPLTVELLAPNGRPVQVTSDLGSFWQRVYPEIRPALRARYPKHRW